MNEELEQLSGDVMNNIINVWNKIQQLEGKANLLYQIQYDINELRLNTSKLIDRIKILEKSHGQDPQQN
jgi:hypothetical protein